MLRRIIPALLLAAALAYDGAYALKFVALGDSRDDMTTWGQVLTKAAAENPELILHSGDTWGGSGTTAWGNVITANPVTNTLLTANKFLVARGNHETWAALQAFSPTLVRNNSERYSFSQGNCFFVSMGYDAAADYTWLTQQLSSAASQAAAWRFIYNHIPIYSTGSGHGANGTTSSGSSIAQYRSLCDQYKVTMCFAGHDHIYERSKLIYNGAAVASGTTFNISTTPGTVYVVTGGAGAPLYSVSANWWVGYNNGTYNYALVDARTDTLLFWGKDKNGTIMDAITIVKNPTTEARRPAGATVADADAFSALYSNGELRIAAGRSIAGAAVISVYSVNGGLVASNKITSLSVNAHVSMGALPPGRYSIFLTTGANVSSCSVVLH